MLTVRAAIVFLIGILTGIGTGILLRLAHRPISLIVISAVAAFALAVQFVNDLIA